MNKFKTLFFYMDNLKQIDVILKGHIKEDYKPHDIINISIEPFEIKRYRVLVTTWERVKEEHIDNGDYPDQKLKKLMGA